MKARSRLLIRAASAVASAALCLGSSDAARALDIPEPEDLGYWRQTVTLPGGLIAVEYLDTRTGETLRFWDDPESRSTIYETYDSEGRIAKRETWLPDRVVTERMTAEGTAREELRPHDSSPAGVVRVRKGVPMPLPAHAFFQGSMGQSCWSPEPVATDELNRMLRSRTSLVRLTEETASGRYVEFGRNTRSRDCSAYPGAPGGNESLRAEAGQALNTGLRCLADLKRRHPRGRRVNEIRNEVARILAYFDERNSQHPFTYMCDRPPAHTAPCDHRAPRTESSPLISCLTQKVAGGRLYAIAKACPDPSDSRIDAPGVILNLTDMAHSTPAERKATLFHETLHMLGYTHSEAARDPDNMDFVYYAETCCFGPRKDRAFACQLISQFPHESEITFE